MKGTRSFQLSFDEYPDTPGWKKRNTSRDAARKIALRALPLKWLALELIRHGQMTADEVATALNESILAVRPRVSELARLGLICDSGDRRINNSGKEAIVWRVR